MIARLSPAEAKRLNTWTVEIATALYEGPAPWQDRGDERHFPGHAGLNINRKSGAWYAFGASFGGWSALRLIAFLKACPLEAAVEWGTTWLASHPGVGAALGYDDGSDTSDTRRRASAARAREIKGSRRPWQRTTARDGASCPS
jgi:hypothetical protein